MRAKKGAQCHSSWVKIFNSVVYTENLTFSAIKNKICRTALHCRVIALHLTIVASNYCTVRVAKTFIYTCNVTHEDFWIVNKATLHCTVISNVYHVERTDTTQQISQVTNVLRPVQASCLGNPLGGVGASDMIDIGYQEVFTSCKQMFVFGLVSFSVHLINGAAQKSVQSLTSEYCIIPEGPHGICGVVVQFLRNWASSIWQQSQGQASLLIPMNPERKFQQVDTSFREV